MFKNTISTYGPISRLFHWVMSIMIIIMLCVGFYMPDLEASDFKWRIYALHKSIGFLVLIFAFLRLLWRLSNTHPTLPNTAGKFEQIGYKIGIRIMYLLMLLIPSAGILMTLYAGYPVSVFDMFTIPGFEANKALSKTFHRVHEYSSIILACAVGVHILIALYHHFILKDRLLLRMVNGK